MSFQAICWAFNQKLERSSAKFVLVCLANYANESFEAYPSTETLSELTSMDRKTVVERLDDLCDLDFIRDTGRRMGITKQVKVYQLNYKESLPKTEASQKRNYSVFPYEGSQKRDTKGSQKRDTDPIREPIREPGGAPHLYLRELENQIKVAEEERELLKCGYAIENSLNGRTWKNKEKQAQYESWGKVIKESKEAIRTKHYKQ